MNGVQRREQIAALLSSRKPLTGTELARQLGVSRQVIVQDVALMRAEDKNILSTNKGYLLYHSSDCDGSCRRVFYVRHTTEQVRDELLCIVELGGRVLDVSVEHELYGQIRADLLINTRQDAEEFCQRLSTSSGEPLKVLTRDCHYHTIAAPSERLLDVIAAELDRKGFLVHL
ncbi:MAG: transcription repressor NadR [Oscillospiraceae bacterium]|nr:transcription repressor NadR [Oscillospiraceae bacterium]